MDSFLKYRGQWGGKIETGEEMWWSEPLDLRGKWRKFLFRLDVRHHFLLRFWDRSSLSSSSRVMDFGCGAGGMTLNFSRAMGCPILGVDVFETQLGIARHFAARENSPCRFGKIGLDSHILMPDGSLDAILSVDVLGHVPDIPKVLKEFARILKPGGRGLLFTESNFSLADRSWMAKLARSGANMLEAVPEHISLFPRERLEEMFKEAGFEVIERYSANVWHFLFFPKDYVLLLERTGTHRLFYGIARVWNRLSKLVPFYPWPFHLLRLAATHLFGCKAYGSSYFYHLKKRTS